MTGLSSIIDAFYFGLRYLGARSPDRRISCGLAESAPHTAFLLAEECVNQGSFHSPWPGSEESLEFLGKPLIESMHESGPFFR